MPLYFHNKLIQFTLKNMLNCYEKNIKFKEQYFGIQTYIKWNYCEYIPLQNLLSAYHCLPLRLMDNKMVVEVVKNRKHLHFQVGYMFYPGLNQNKVFKYQVGNMILIFD